MEANNLNNLNQIKAEVLQKLESVTAVNEVVRKDVDTLKTNQQLQYTNVQSIKREVIRNKQFIEATKRELVANMKEMEYERRNCILWDRDANELRHYSNYTDENRRITEYAFDLIIRYMTTFDRRDFKAKRLKQNEEDNKKNLFRLLITFNNVSSADVFRDRCIQGAPGLPKILKIRSGLTRLERQLMFETKTLVDTLNKNNKTPKDFAYARKFMFKVCKVDPNDSNKIIEVLKDNNPASNWKKVIMSADAPLLPFYSGERPTFGAQSTKRKASQEGVGTPGDKTFRCDTSQPPPPLPMGMVNRALTAKNTPKTVALTTPSTSGVQSRTPVTVEEDVQPDTIPLPVSSESDEDDGKPKKEPKKIYTVVSDDGKELKIPGQHPMNKISKGDFNALTKDEIRKRSDKQARLLAQMQQEKEMWLREKEQFEKEKLELMASQNIVTQEVAVTSMDLGLETNVNVAAATDDTGAVTAPEGSISCFNQ